MIRDVAPVFPVIEDHRAVGGVNGEGQGIVIQATMLHFFWHLAHPLRSADLIQIHRQQPFGKQHLLGIKQLIERVGRLLPGDKACGKPGRQRQQQEKKRQTEFQAQFHASPRV